jgi:hypothetical protein
MHQKITTKCYFINKKLAKTAKFLKTSTKLFANLFDILFNFKIVTHSDYLFLVHLHCFELIYSFTLVSYEQTKFGC